MKTKMVIVMRQDLNMRKGESAVSKSSTKPYNF